MQLSLVGVLMANPFKAELKAGQAGARSPTAQEERLKEKLVRKIWLILRPMQVPMQL